MSDHDSQDRGRRDAYDRYLAGMDASMRQKVALTAAHLLGRGRIADMGMGSGSGSHALAALYPDVEVIGVDLDPTMVALARERYQLSNLSFLVGDIAKPVTEPASLDAILDSSVLHHVTSFGGYDYGNAARALTAQVEQLASYGVLVVRDFLAPGAGDVWLDLPADDGDDGDDPRTCSTAALFQRFGREFRSLAPSPGFSVRTDASPSLPPASAGRRRFSTSHRIAVEFVLRKDYREDWGPEVKEEYTYFTQDEFEEHFAGLGLRVLVSSPLRNPWIVRNRFRGLFELRSNDGAAVDHPPTNYVIVGEKVPANEGVRWVEVSSKEPLGFLEMSHYRHRTTGHVTDLVRRPNGTVDVLPWFTASGEIFVIARGSYPRPILSCELRGTASVDGSRAPHYVTEPLSVIQGDKPLGQTAEDLLERFGFGPEKIVALVPGSTYYPSPGGVQEEVRSVLVELTPPHRAAPFDGTPRAGRVRAIEAQQLLRAAQVGGLPDARLELNVYELLRVRGASVGPWIGEALDVPVPDRPPEPVSVAAAAARPARRVFTRVGPEASTGFLSKECSVFRELNASGETVRETTLELVVPRPLSFNTAAVAVLTRSGDEILIGLDDHDLPAAQCFTGASSIFVTPAWRLPHHVTSPTPMAQWIKERLADEHELRVATLHELGGRYHPSPGVTPEVVHPLAVTVGSCGSRARRLTWVSLEELVRGPDGLLVDGHLRVLALRAAHALGLLR